MPRPVLARKSMAGKKAAAAKVAATTASGTTVTSKDATTSTTTASTTTAITNVGNSKDRTVGGRATRKAGTTIGEGRVTRRGAAASVERSLLQETEDEGEWNVLPAEEDPEKTEEVKRVAAERATRRRGRFEVEVQIEVKEKEKKKGGRGKKEVKVELEDSREVEVEIEVEETPAKKRPVRTSKEKKTEESVDAGTDLIFKTPVREVVGREEVVEEEEAEVMPQKKKPGRPSKSKAPVKKAARARKEDKGKGRATDVEDEVPSSPPTIPTADSTLQNNIPEQDDLSSTSSIYGDENFLPPPLASSTPKAGAAATVTTLPVSPPKPLFRSSEGYTPPPLAHHRSGAGAGPSAAAGPSMERSLSPIRRRLWESTPAPSSPNPLSQCETPKTAAVEDEGPLGFDIYEDSSQKPSSSASASADPLLRLMDIDRDARGDGARANILRTPKKKIAGFEPRKRTSTGTKKSPDGKIIEEDEDEDESESESSDDSDSDGNSSDEATPKAKPMAEAEPKRQKRAPENRIQGSTVRSVANSSRSGPRPEKEEEKKLVLTRDLLGLAPRRRRGAKGPARSTRNKEPVVDDLGEDLTSELEDEISRVTKKRAAAATGKGGRARATKDKGTTITKKAVPLAKKAAKGKNTVAVVETPKKGRGRGGSISNSKSGGMKTYGRPKSVVSDSGSDGSATPVPADKENDATMVEPSSKLTGKDSIGVGKEGRRKLKEIKKAFSEVDMWEMEFEDVQASSET
ncbi:hypothetical protein EV426DRAFT_615196 [Tirmania nivea]|nr:hypothetical protein EV426DRAFT_615196 [Tirmania nivea]